MDDERGTSRRLEEQDVLARLGEIYTPAAALSSVEAAAVTLADALDSIGADAGFVAKVAPQGAPLEVLRVTPHSGNLVRLAFPVDSPYPLAEAIRARKALFIESNEMLRCDHPGLVRVEEADHACATLPLFDGENLLGALNVSFEDPHAFGDDERRQIESIARSCAMVLARGDAEN